MGLFDIFKKRGDNGAKASTTPTNSSTSTPPSHLTKSYQAQTIGKPSIAKVSDMIDFGLKWQEKFLEDCFSFPSSSVKAEALMFTCWRVWYHCLENNVVSRDQSYVSEFFAHIMTYEQSYDARFDDINFFMPLFKNRYGIFRSDLVGLCNSNFPVTKQYLPISTYRVFFVEPLEVIDPSTSTISSLSTGQMDEMTEFLDKFIMLSNAMTKELDDVF